MDTPVDGRRHELKELSMELEQISSQNSFGYALDAIAQSNHHVLNNVLGRIGQLKAEIWCIFDHASLGLRFWTLVTDPHKDVCNRIGEQMYLSYLEQFYASNAREKIRGSPGRLITYFSDGNHLASDILRRLREFS